MVKMVSAYQGMKVYIQAARLETATPDELWRRYVIDPYWVQWAAGEYNEERVRDNLSQPYTDVDGLEKIIATLEKSGIETVLTETYARIRTQLPYHEEDAAVCILAGDPGDSGLVETLQGAVGECVGANTLLRINPTAAGWQEMASYVLAHERHHSAWGYHHFVLHHDLPPCLLASLISEGSADVFARQICPGVHPAWTDALSPVEEAAQWEIMRPLLDAPDFDGTLYRRFFFGDPNQGTPAFSGYTIGYRIVQGYVTRHPRESVAAWTLRPPQEILAESGYGV